MRRRRPATLSTHSHVTTRVVANGNILEPARRPVEHPNAVDRRTNKNLVSPLLIDQRTDLPDPLQRNMDPLIWVHLPAIEVAVDGMADFLERQTRVTDVRPVICACVILTPRELASTVVRRELGAADVDPAKNSTGLLGLLGGALPAEIAIVHNHIGLAVIERQPQKDLHVGAVRVIPSHNGTRTHPADFARSKRKGRSCEHERSKQGQKPSKRNTTERTHKNDLQKAGRKRQGKERQNVTNAHCLKKGKPYCYSPVQ
jgi:hypothetical protein